MKRKMGFGVVLVMVVALAALSFMPMINTDRWWIRLLDFPRLQASVALVVLALPVLFYFRYFRRMAGLCLILIASALSYHAYVLFPYLPTGSDFPVADCPAGNAITVMVANVKMHNDPDGKLLDMVQDVQPDVLLAMETNAKWNEALAPLTKTMPHTVSHISGSYYGIHLFSRLPLVDPQIRFLAGQEIPQVVSGITLGNGEAVDFLGVHPRPPVPSRPDTTLARDAVLYKAGLLARERAGTAIVAGDFNATPWETAVERMRQLGNLQDPRRSYGFVPTFSAQSWWMSWPLDQIFHEPGFATVSLERLPSFGSDHYPFLGKFCRTAMGEDESVPQADEELIRKAKEVIAAASR
ncbi:endonuclease/exonuclease/phosphatase family protein [Hydrocarboniclastica marina]|uniref:Endonuclease/exonuclease/phosphatase family protein n=1 Tax=Hydrocarboniclastica marina TaxID=2259620 RepID=A0A4P7XIK8_9ALTE|nr:endonuclease/exonuclease/phosphatase family protein [Hydrocarboniclastica marina]QCF26919.1 endonuclease/exonuclease/phosphatase family protein [Hydrocarboniclastica marina]